MRRKKSKKEWESDPRFRDWLRVGIDPNYGDCTFCNTSISLKTSNLSRHMDSKDHAEIAQSLARIYNENNDSNSSAEKKLDGQELERNALVVDAIYNEQLNSDVNQDSSEQCDAIDLVALNSTDRSINKDYKNYGQHFQKAWEKKDGYASCIKPIKGQTGRVACIVCKDTMTSKTTVIDKHLDSLKHKGNNGEDVDLNQKFDPVVAAAEIRIAALCADHDLSFRFTNNMIQFMKSLFIDSELLEKVKINDKKVQDIINNVIAIWHKDHLIDILNKTKFSIMVDESTDRSVDSYLCINVRYADDEKEKIVDTLWELVPVYDADENSTANADNLFKKIISTFTDVNVDTKNIMAFCSDGANVMRGEKNSVFQKLECLNPNIIQVKCKCHLEHLCARDAIKKIPNEYTNVCSASYNYVSGSAKKTNRWKVAQRKMGLKPLKFLRPCATRWLETLRDIQRILRRYPCLKFFLHEEIQFLENTSNSQSSEQALDTLLNLVDDPLCEGYLTFLESTLSILVRANEILQSVTPIISEGIDLMSNAYIQILRRYMEETYIDRFVSQSMISHINPANHEYFKKKVDLGVDTRKFLKTITMTTEQKNSFTETCRSVYIEICAQMHKRFTFDDLREIHSKVFHPKNALSAKFREEYPDLNNVFNEFKSIVDDSDQELKNKINNEWMNLVQHDFPENVRINLDKIINPDDFWFAIKKVTNTEDELLFENIARFSLHALCIPNSNATPERTWSKMKNLKTEKRGSLVFSSIRGELLAAQCVKDKGGALKFEPPNEMIERMRKSIRTRKRKRVKKDDSNSNTYKTYGDNIIEEHHLFEAMEADIRYCRKYGALGKTRKEDDDESDNDDDNDDDDDDNKNHEAAHGSIQETLSKNYCGTFNNDNDDEDVNVYDTHISKKRQIENEVTNEDLDIIIEELKHQRIENFTEHFIIDDQGSILATEISEQNVVFKEKLKSVSFLEDISVNDDDNRLDLFNLQMSQGPVLATDISEQNSVFKEKLKSVSFLEDISVNDDDNELDLFNLPLSPIMQNGLMPDYVFYKERVEVIIENHKGDIENHNINYTIGQYSSIKNHPIRDYRVLNNMEKPLLFNKDHTFKLFSEEYQTLFVKNDSNNYIDGDVIDAFCAIKEREWRNTIFVPTQITKLLLVKTENQTPDDNWFMYHLNGRFKGTILMPYEYCNHWCLFIVNVNKKTLTHIDPYRNDLKCISSRLKMCEENFIKYLQLANSKVKNNLNSITDWTLQAYRKIRPFQKDGYNCGSFIMYYMDCIGKGDKYDKNFDPLQYRIHIANLLLSRSDDMKNVCQLCFSTRFDVLNEFKCCKCKRYTHTRCYKLNYLPYESTNTCVLCAD